VRVEEINLNGNPELFPIETLCQSFFTYSLTSQKTTSILPEDNISSVKKGR